MMHRIALLTYSLFLLVALQAQVVHSFTYTTQTASGREAVTYSHQGVPPQRTCGTMEMDSLLRIAYPQTGTMQQFEDWLQLQIAKESANNNIYSLPVIVHVIHNGESIGIGRNISAAQVQSQIDVLNEDFRRLNPDTVNTPAAYRPVAADTRIEFCPAIVDEQQNTLTEAGIHRVNRNIAGFTAPPYTSNYIDNVIKPATIWDPARYFNIWVVDISGGILGYAQFPTQSGLPGLPSSGSANTDGIVVGYRYFGRGNFPQLAAPYNLGRTATHEVGHWLGLRHIWGDGGCGVDDFCNDTPLSDAPNYGCATSEVSCGSDDMVENYMDYSNDACFNLFTDNQKTRMRTVLENSPRRLSLLTSIVCNPNVAPVADFTANPLVVYAGGTVRFEDLSTGNPTQWNWQFQGGLPATSISQNPVVRYNTPGNYAVVLTASNANGSDQEVKTAYITVIPAPSCDTLNFPPPGQLTLYTLGGQPIIGWNTNLLDISKAQYFNNYQPYQYITGGIFYFARAKKAVNSNATVTFAVWDNQGQGGEPGNILDSVVVDLANIQAIVANNSLVQVTFDPVTITGNFYLGFKMNNFTANDSLGLVSNTSGSSPRGLAWEQWGDNSWHPMDSVYQINGAPFSVSMFASPLVTQTLPTATFTAASQQVCQGEAITFTAGTQPGNSYIWVFEGGTPYLAFGDSVTVTYDTAGTHSVYLLANGACAAQDDTLATDLIEVNTIPAVDSFATVPAGCGQANGTATAIVTGGTGPYTYEWDANTGYQTGPTANNLASGSYFLYLTDAKGCTDVGIANVGSANGPAGTVANTTDVSCFGGANGAATVQASQGTPPYTYTWPGGATGASRSNLSAGSYDVTVTDDRSCTTVVTVVINQPDSIRVQVAGVQVSCRGNDGSATATVLGGTPPYSYQWSNGAGGNPASGLSAGTYFVTVTDAKQCQQTAQVTIGTLPAITVGLNPQPASCVNNNGSIVLSASGGAAPLTHQWSNGQTGDFINGLSTGMYSVTTTDARNCTKVDSALVGLLDDLVGTISGDQSICLGETATLQAGGGSAYSWSPAPGTGGQSASIQVQPNSTTTFTCVITTGPCADTLSAMVTVLPLPATTITEGDTIVVCRDEQVTLTATGASSYNWSTGAQGASISFTAVNTQDIIVNGTSADGCDATDTIHVQVETCTGVAVTDGLQWTVYPNPASYAIHVQAEWNLSDDVSLELLDATGRLVWSQQTYGHQLNVTVPVQQLSAGMYHLRLSVGGKVHVQPVVVGR